MRNDNVSSRHVLANETINSSSTIEDLKTEIGMSSYETDTNCYEADVKSVKRKKFSLKLKKPVFRLLTLFILGSLSWGILTAAWGRDLKWNGAVFKVAIVPVIAFIAGHLFTNLTTLPPQPVELLVGILSRHFGYLDMRDHEDIDSILRKVYPVVILGKSSLAWDISFMQTNWKKVTSLGILPWLTEVLVLAGLTKFLLGFPFIWGILLGSVYASVSCAVVLPSVSQLASKGSYLRNWPQLICTAGGIDTMLSVGVYGVIFSYIFHPASDDYRIMKAVLTLFVGVALGISWGTAAKYLPHKKDFYVAELRILFVLLGGLFCNFFTSFIGWAGTGGVAVLACNMTAANHWKYMGWPLNKNPASTAYRVMWAVLEPTLFAFTGTFFVFDPETLNTVAVGFGILAICLSARLAATATVCHDFNTEEKLYVCSNWLPKTIVEAVLCPLALTAVQHSSQAQKINRKNEVRHAEDIIRLIVQAIMLTTPVAFIITHYLGPRLLKSTKCVKIINEPVRIKSCEETSTI